MRKIDLGQTVAIVANLGVIIGIVFLAVEIRQSNTLARSQTRSDLAIAMADQLNGLADNPDLAEVWVRAQANFADLDSVETQRVVNRAGAMLKLWENTYYQYRSGLLDEVEYLGERNTMRRILNSPPYSSVFCMTGTNISEAFRREAESLLDQNDCMRGNSQ